MTRRQCNTACVSIALASLALTFASGTALFGFIGGFLIAWLRDSALPDKVNP